jgi:hypothetical protein
MQPIFHKLQSTEMQTLILSEFEFTLICGVCGVAFTWINLR